MTASQAADSPTEPTPGGPGPGRHGDTLGGLTDPEAALAELRGARAPHLIGVRHHSPALSVALAELLAAADPQVLAIELPAEAADWIDWLADPQVQAPVAMAFSAGPGHALSFYPFADYSPELVALRWALAHGVEVVCIDLPIGFRPPPVDDAAPIVEDDDAAQIENDEASQIEGGTSAPDDGAAWHRQWADALSARARAEAGDTDETWDRLVEAPAPGAGPEQIRVAALAHGWATRASSPIDPHTAAREAWMRARLAELADRRVTAVIGSFHAPALLDIGAATEPEGDVAEVQSCLVGYSFAQLDSRSGYPAGIRDPAWQQSVVTAAGDPAAINAALATHITQTTRELREQGHPAGPREAAECLRIAQDLAALRGLRAPARRELIETVTGVLAQGEVLGRGRSVAAALSRVLVGDRHGHPAPGTPQSPLRATLRAELAAVRLPSEVNQGRELRLAPLRGGLDLTRHVLLRRLQVGGVTYGRREATSTWRGAETIASTWEVDWTPATEASIDLAATRGLSAEQIATTALLTEAVGEDQLLSRLTDAADVTAPEATAAFLDRLIPMAAHVDFQRAVAAVATLADIATARLPGARLLPTAIRERAGELRAEFTGAAIREIDGIAGSTDVGDARALAALSADAAERELSLARHLHGLADHGSPLMQGAAIGLLCHDDAVEPTALGAIVGSWVDAAAAGQRQLKQRLTGLLTTASSLLTTSAALAPLVERISTVDDGQFVTALPGLRGGFDVLGEEGRAVLLNDLAAELGRMSDLSLSAEDTLAAVAHDERARRRLEALGLADLRFSAAERWRLVLGSSRGSLSPGGARMAATLDELYGRPHDDALDPALRGSRGAGTGVPRLGVRSWQSEIEALFSPGHVQEIFTDAAEQGRPDVLAALDPDTVRPSVELLTTALSLTGSLSEARLSQLRPLVRRLVRELTEALAVRIRPALTGTASARPTRRRSGRLDLPRTIRRNLRHVVEVDGRPQVVPVTPLFQGRTQKTADWHLIVLVDVSGSMSESVVFSALTAAILTGVPALQVTFLAFSTEVIDFSSHLDDPLALLLEVDIGGGTDIAGAVRQARSMVRVPSRTLCVIVSDFEEWGSPAPLLAEVAALHTSGVKLMGCAALSDSGEAVYNVGVAQQLAGVGMRVAAVSPVDLARWVGDVVRG